MLRFHDNFYTGVLAETKFCSIASSLNFFDRQTFKKFTSDLH
ncbi:MAG: hypothetical protein QNJ54_02620 [Prochloraceae cyanobacterium]|nr:hypothetical protein [Prochloraceae cyanobacterium]